MAIQTDPTATHEYLADGAGRARTFSYCTIAFLVAEQNAPQLRAAGWFPYLVHAAPSDWRIALARSEAEAVRRNEF